MAGRHQRRQRLVRDDRRRPRRRDAQRRTAPSRAGLPLPDLQRLHDPRRQDRARPGLHGSTSTASTTSSGRRTRSSRCRTGSPSGDRYDRVRTRILVAPRAAATARASPDQKASEMPIINIRFIKDVVATEEQKARADREDDGHVRRACSATSCGRSPTASSTRSRSGCGESAACRCPTCRTSSATHFAEVREKSNQTMRDAIAQMAADAENAERQAEE